MGVRAKSGLVLRDVAGISVVIPVGERVVDLNGLVTLNETGKHLWALLDGTHSPADMALALTLEFEVSLAQAENDVQAFLTELQQMGLLEDAADGL